MLAAMANLQLDLILEPNALRDSAPARAGSIHLVTSASFERAPYFRDFATAACACRGFTRPEALADAALLAWVLLPDQVHWLVELGAREPLERVVAGLKAASTRAVRRERGLEGPLWAPSFHTRDLRHRQEARTAARHLLASPLRAGLAPGLGAYPFWDTVWTGLA
jgi:REP element-mobilizing transposase RayT